MKKIALAALLASTAPLAAMADTTTGALTLSYTQHSQGGFDIETKGIDGRLAVDMDNGLSFGVEIGSSTMSQDGAPFDYEAEFYSVDASYRFGNGFRAGLYADRLSMGIDLLPIDMTLKTNGVTLGYAGNGFDVEGIFGQTSMSIPFMMMPVDISNYGIVARYTGMDKLVAGATFLRANISNGVEDENIDFRGVAATYEINDRLMVFGGAGQMNMPILMGDLNSFGLGVSYDIGASMGYSASLSAEFGRLTNDSSDHQNVLRVGLTIPLGKSGPVLPMNSVADAILNPRHGAFNAGMTAAY